MPVRDKSILASIISGIILVIVSLMILINNGNQPAAWQDNSILEEQMTIKSPDFESGSLIPIRFTCDGDNINPRLDIAAVPLQSASLVLIVDDPDAPAGTADPGWVHWLVYNIPPQIASIEADSVPAGSSQGLNDWNQTLYGGPCPPSGIHHYYFRLYALDTVLEFPTPPTKARITSALQEHVLEQTEIIGLYSRQ